MVIGLLFDTDKEEYELLDETKSISVAKLIKLFGRKMPSCPRLKEVFNRSDEVAGLFVLYFLRDVSGDAADV